MVHLEEIWIGPIEQIKKKNLKIKFRKSQKMLKTKNLKLLNISNMSNTFKRGYFFSD
jgi:hypothetical protein